MCVLWSYMYDVWCVAPLYPSKKKYGKSTVERLDSGGGFGDQSRRSVILVRAVLEISPGGSERKYRSSLRNMFTRGCRGNGDQDGRES